MMMGVRSDERMVKGQDWKSFDFQENPLPENIEDIKNKVDIAQNIIDIDGAKIFYQVGNPPEGVEETGTTVLLLHGAAFTSQTWVDKVPTLTTLAAVGHNVIAVDLPGYGKSRQARVGDNGEFLAKMIKAITKRRPIVVTPSMSGSFFIPMLAEPTNRDLVSGWIPVAPVGTSQASGFYKSIQLPTLIVYGENDRGLGHRSRDDLSELPNATKPQVLPDSRHPAYLDQPKLWHTLIYNFIQRVPV